MTFSPCILIPTYNNPATIRKVVNSLRGIAPGVPIIVIDDHSAAEGERAVAEITAEGLVKSMRRPVNGGKGAAVRDGFRFGRELGFTHALQIDADGQHCIEDVPRFLSAAERMPDALILGRPLFDETAPKSRMTGRKISIFWTTLETGFNKLIDDPLCGMRVYPIQAAIDSGSLTSRMEFDPEIAVRMAWNGVPILNLSTRVRYINAEDGGISHFHPFRDNFMMSLMHTRMVLTLAGRKILDPMNRKRPAMSRIDLPEDDPLNVLPPIIKQSGGTAAPEAQKMDDTASQKAAAEAQPPAASKTDNAAEAPASAADDAVSDGAAPRSEP